MRQISIVVLLSLVLLITGCGSTTDSEGSSTAPAGSESQTATPINEVLLADVVNADYYQEGLRLLEQYCNETSINGEYDKIKDYTRQELMSDQSGLETMKMLNNIVEEYQGRATNQSEQLFAEKVGTLVIESVMIPLSMYNKDDAARNNDSSLADFTKEVNDFHASVGILKVATKVSELDLIETKLIPQ